MPTTPTSSDLHAKSPATFMMGPLFVTDGRLSFSTLQLSSFIFPSQTASHSSSSFPTATQWHSIHAVSQVPSPRTDL